jgi:hypothetical protein
MMLIIEELNKKTLYKLKTTRSIYQEDEDDPDENQYFQVDSNPQKPSCPTYL